jgi:hypothetical protein
MLRVLSGHLNLVITLPQTNYAINSRAREVPAFVLILAMGSCQSDISRAQTETTQRNVFSCVCWFSFRSGASCPRNAINPKPPPELYLFAFN